MAERVWSRTLRLRAQDVNMFRTLRTSRLLELMQEASIAHTEELGWPRATTLDRGFLWMIAMQRVEIERMPAYDEAVTVSSWPGETMHVLFPRQYRIEDEQGNVLVRGSALWTLVDMETRALADPDVHGVEIGGVETGCEIELPRTLRSEECDQSASFTVPFSYCDLNGHMNNTRYFDLAEDCLPAAAEGRRLRAVQSEYVAEARLGDALTVHWGESEGVCTLQGEAGKPIFRLRMEYEA